MYCPICSTKVALDQKFCRSCGLGLDKVSQAIAEQHPIELARNLEEQKNKLERLGVIALSVFGIGIVSFFLSMIGYKILAFLAQGKILPILGLIGLTVVLASGLVAVILFAKAKDVQAESTKRRLKARAEMPESPHTAKLLEESTFEPLPSVTERTTDLIYTEKPKRS